MKANDQLLCIFLGKWCSLTTLIERRVVDTIEFLTDVTDSPDILYVEGNVGYDGNGQNSKYRSCNNGHHFILGGACLICIKDGDGNVVFEEKSLGHSIYIRTVSS